MLWTFHKNLSTGVKLTAVIIFMNHHPFWYVNICPAGSPFFLPDCLLLRIASSRSVVLFSNAGFLCALAINCRKRSKSSPYRAGPQTLEPAGKGRSGIKICGAVIVKLRYFYTEARERKMNSASKHVQLQDYPLLQFRVQYCTCAYVYMHTQEIFV